MGHFRRAGHALGCSLLLSLCLFRVESVFAFGDVSYLPSDEYDQRWSIAATARVQVSPYTNENRHKDFVPLLTYTGETFFLAGTKAGIHLLHNDDWRVDLYTAYRFDGYDNSKMVQQPDLLWKLVPGTKRRNSIDGGFSVTRMTALGDFTLDAVSDISHAYNGQVASLYWGRRYNHGHWEVLPWIGMTWYSANYNDYYYGVRQDEVTADLPYFKGRASVSYRLGSDIRYDIDDRQILTFNMEYERLADSIYDSPIVNQINIFKLGLNYRILLSDEHNARGYTFMNTRDYPWSIRVAGGFFTDVTLNRIVRGDIKYDANRPGLISLFMGRQVSNTFLHTNWEVWVYGGIARRFEKNLQHDFFEYVGDIKLYYSRFPWSDKIKTRFGFAEGLSYADKVPYLEKVSIDKKNVAASRLLNFLDVSIDVNVGDVFKTDRYRNCYTGFSVHHRSGIFGSSDIFGPVDGGSNVNTLYLECLYH